MVLLLPLILLSHLVFFGLGFIMLTDEAMSNYYYHLGDNFKELPLLLSFIIMVLLSIGWLILLFRNNAFKRFYPVSRWQLFGFYYYIVLLRKKGQNSQGTVAKYYGYSYHYTANEL